MDIFASLTKETSTPTSNASKPLPKEEEQGAEGTSTLANENEESNSSDVETSDAEAGDNENVSGADADNVIEVKGRGKSYSFKLDKNDKKLQEALSWGAIGPSLAAEKKALKRELEALKTSQASSPDMNKYVEANDLAQAGYVSTAIKEILGEDAFKKFYNEEIIARIDYENASPEERLKLFEERAARREAELNWKLERTKGSKVKETQQSKEAQAKTKELEIGGYAKAAISRLDFAALDGDKAAQETYKVKVHKMAFDDIQEWAEAHKEAGREVEVTQAIIEKAVKRNFSLLTGARGRGIKDGSSTSSASGGKQAAAKAASKNYDKSTAEDLKGLSPAAIFNKLRGK
jgi:hypothetical protein